MMAAPKLRAWQRKAAKWVLHTTGLFAAMAAPFIFLPKIDTASLAAAGAGFAFLLSWLVVLFFRDRGKPWQPAKIVLLHTLYELSVPTAVYGLMAFLILEWVLWAYLPITSSAETWDALMIAQIAVAAILIYPPILFLLFAPRLARKNGGPASRFLKGVRARGFGWFQISWLGNMTIWAGVSAVGWVFLTPQLLQWTERWRDSDGIVTIWELVAAYPFLPFALLATAAILALSNVLITGRETDEAIDRAYIDGAAEEPWPAPRARVALGGLVAGASVATLLMIVYSVHLGIMAKGGRDVRTALGGVADALVILGNTREDDDWTIPEVAAALNRYGHWTPDAPGEGLGELIADPREAFPGNCTVRTAAGIVDPPFEGPHSGLDLEAGKPDLKFCVALVCTSPTTWSAPPTRLLVTSHASQAEGWRDNSYVDAVADGVAPEPGGYCNADGRLADTYQG